MSLLILCILLASQTSTESALYSIHKGIIRFSSEAPLETIKGTSSKLKGLINPTTRSFALSVNNNTISGFNSLLQQEHFHENYIETDKYPTSTFEGKIIEDIDFSKNGVYTVRTKGILKIHGVAKERIIKSSVRIKDGVLFVNARFSILLEEHNITIPRIVLQKIASEISITVEAEFLLKGASPK